MLHSDRDVVVLSPTGSGKTLAYLLPLVQMLDAKLDRLQAVVVVPGRELALQSATVLKDMGCGLRAMSLYGGRPAMDEHRQMRTVNPQIVFATPGRLNDHLDKANLSADDVHYLVLDEFDKCLAMGFRGEMTALLDKLPNVQRRILLSATDAEAIPAFVQMGRTTRIDNLTEDEQVPERVCIYKVRWAIRAASFSSTFARACSAPTASCARQASPPVPFMEAWTNVSARMRSTSSAMARPMCL